MRETRRQRSATQWQGARRRTQTHNHSCAGTVHFATGTGPRPHAARRTTRAQGQMSREWQRNSAKHERGQIRKGQRNSAKHERGGKQHHKKANIAIEPRGRGFLSTVAMPHSPTPAPIRGRVKGPPSRQSLTRKGGTEKLRDRQMKGSDSSHQTETELTE